MLGDGGHQRRRRGVGVLPAQEVDGSALGDHPLHVRRRPARTRDTAPPDRGLEEQRQRLLNGGDRVACRPVVPVEGATQKAVPEGRGRGMRAQDLLGLRGVVRVSDPHEHVVQGRLGERCGVEVGLQDLRRLGRVEAGRLVAGAAAHGAADGPGGEGLGATLGRHGVGAPLDRVPDELRYAGREVERIEDVNRSVVRCTCSDRQVEVVGLGQGDKRGTRGGQQRRRQEVEGLARPLGAEHTGGSIEGHPQVHAAGNFGPPEPPAELGRVDGCHWCLPRARSGRSVRRLLISCPRPRTAATSCLAAMPNWAKGPTVRHHKERPSVAAAARTSSTTAAAAKTSASGGSTSRRGAGSPRPGSPASSPRMLGSQILPRPHKALTTQREGKSLPRRQCEEGGEQPHQPYADRYLPGGREDIGTPVLNPHVPSSARGIRVDTLVPGAVTLSGPGPLYVLSPLPARSSRSR